jgi:hypothetical protein
MHSITDTDIDTDHHAAVYVNGSPVGEVWWDGATEMEATFEFSQGLLAEGENTVTVKGLLDTGASYSIFYVDSFDLTYQRLYEAVDDSLVLQGGWNAIVTVTGFKSPDIMVFNITDPLEPVLVEAVTVAEDAYGQHSVSLYPESSGATYLALSVNAVVMDYTSWADEASDLGKSNNRADYLIITPEELEEGAAHLSEYRQGQSLDTMVVKLEDIMDEFNYGNFSPDAIRDFLAYAYGNWSKAPRYVVLLGEGTYDYKDNYGYGGNLIPTAMVDTPYGLFASDNYFADIDEDGVPEMVIGRLPVLTEDELEAYVSKVKAYESYKEWENRVLLVADDSDDGGDFSAYSNRIASLIPDEYTVQKVYLGEHSTSEARDLIMEAINDGVVSMNYIGHGSPDSMAYEGLLKGSDMDSLENGSKLPVVSAMTCFVGNFSYPGYDSLSESLILKRDGGAIAVWAPTGLSLNAQAMIMDEKFFRSVYEDGTEIFGDAVLESFKKFGSRQPDSAFIIQIYNILGDPALRLK